jgi:serine/threonine-protein kinase
VNTDPTTIGRYSVLHRLGAGGMGCLYLARDPSLDRLVAVKLLLEDLSDNSELRERFSREARAAARLRHPNIVTIFEFGDLDGRPFIAMEYVPGESLGEMICRGAPLSLQQKLSYIDDLCSGLAHAHKAGIVHRDIKPANIMIDRDGVLKIVDFGIARLAESTMTRQGDVVGTVNHMSPEQLVGGAIDQRSDVFAVGTVLYEILTYTKAFPGTIADGVIERIMRGSPEPVSRLCPGVDPRIERIIARALEKHVSDRYQDLLDMRKEIAALRSSPTGRPERTDNSSAATGATVPVEMVGAPSPAPGRRARGTQAERFVRRRRDEIEGHLEAARRALEGGDYEAAIEHAERAATIDPREGRALDIIEQGRTALDVAEARKHLSLAVQCLERKDVIEASGWVRQASALVPADGAEDLRRELQKVRYGIERGREHARVIVQAIERAQHRLAEGAYGSAIRAAYEVLALDPRHPEALKLVTAAEAAAAERAGQQEEAQRAAAAIVESQALFESAAHETAVDRLRAITPAPPNVTAVLLDMQAEYQAILERRPADELEGQARAEITRARALAAAGKYDIALRALREFEPPHPAVTAAIAEVERAFAAFEERRRKEELEGAVQRLVADARERVRTGDHQGALDALREWSPPHREVCEALADLERQLVAIEETPRKENEERRVRATLGWARQLFDEGAFAEALAVLREFAPPHPLVSSELVLLERKLAEHEEACRRDELDGQASAAIARARQACDLGNAEAALTALEQFAPPHEAVAAALAEMRADWRQVQERQQVTAPSPEAPPAALGYEVTTPVDREHADLLNRYAYPETVRLRAGHAERAVPRGNAETVVTPGFVKTAGLGPEVSDRQPARSEYKAPPPTVADLQPVGADESGGREPRTERSEQSILERLEGPVEVTSLARSPIPLPADWVEMLTASPVTAASSGLFSRGRLIAAAAGMVALIVVLALLTFTGRKPTTPPASATTKSGAASADEERPHVSVPSEPAPIPLPPIAASTETPALTKVRALARQQVAQGSREQALETCVGGLKTWPADPDLRGILDAILGEALKRAGIARREAVTAEAPSRAASAYNDAVRQQEESSELLNTNRPDESVRVLWRAAQLFAAAAEDARRAAAVPSQLAAPLPPSADIAKAIAETVVASPRPREPAVVAPSVSRPSAGVENVPAGDPVAMEAGVRETLQRYQHAFESLDAGAIKAIQPWLGPTDQNRLQASFRDFRSLTMQMVVGSIQVTADGATATAHTVVEQKTVVKSGTAPPVIKQRVVFTLRRRADGWIIERVDRTPLK